MNIVVIGLIWLTFLAVSMLLLFHNAPVMTTCPQCGNVIEPKNDRCPVCGGAQWLG